MLGDAVAGFFHRAAKGQCRFADDGIPTHGIEDRDFVLVCQPALPALMVQDNNVVCFRLDVVGYDTRTALAKGLNNFSSLRARATGATSPECPVSASGGATHLPGMAISNKDTRFVIGLRDSRWNAGKARNNICQTYNQFFHIEYLLVQRYQLAATVANVSSSRQ